MAILGLVFCGAVDCTGERTLYGPGHEQPSDSKCKINGLVRKDRIRISLIDGERLECLFEGIECRPDPIIVVSGAFRHVRSVSVPDTTTRIPLVQISEIGRKKSDLGGTAAAFGLLIVGVWVVLLVSGTHITLTVPS